MDPFTKKFMAKLSAPELLDIVEGGEDLTISILNVREEILERLRIAGGVAQAAVDKANKKDLPQSTPAAPPKRPRRFVSVATRKRMAIAQKNRHAKKNKNNK